MEDVLVKQDQFHFRSMNIEGIYAELPILVMFFFNRLNWNSSRQIFVTILMKNFMLTPYKIQNINSW